MTTIDNLISIREIQKEDINFILSSTLLCLTKYTESIVKGMNRSDAYNYLEKIILCALTRIDSSIFIACHKEDSNNIIAYIIADPHSNHIYFQYTKYSYRKLGIQRNLLLPLVTDPSLPISVNWPTKEMLKLAASSRVNIRNKFVDTLIELLFLKES